MVLGVRVQEPPEHDDIYKVKGEYVNLSENHNLIFGIPSDVREFECNSDVLRYKIRYRSQDFVWVALKYEDRVERWYIGKSKTEPPYWYPAIHIGSNINA